MKTIRMPKDILAKWLAALRSGDYKQGMGHLCENGAYCCLGVLQQIVDGYTTADFARDIELPPLEWLASRRISFSNSYCGSSSSPYLDVFNDIASNVNDAGYSFAEIADAIAEAAEGY